MPTNDYIIRTKATGVKATRGAVRGLSTAVGSFLKIAAPLVGVAATFKAIKDSIAIAQDIKPVENAFKNMTKAAGMSVDTFDKLRKATDGTVGSMELMKQANNVMMLGVADSEEQMAEMFDTAQRLAAAVGQDATFGIESLVTGLGRQSKLMLDNLGIMVDTNASYVNYARSLGKAAKDLTEAERKQAFINEALSQAKNILADVGEEQLGFKEQVSKLKADLEDMGRVIGDFLLPKLAHAIDVFYDIAGAIKNLGKATQGLDLWATFRGFLNNLPAFVQTIRLIWADVIDFMIDAIPPLFTGWVKTMGKILTWTWNTVKGFASYWTEPLMISFSIFTTYAKLLFQEMWAGLKGMVVDGINFIIDQYNRIPVLPDISFEMAPPDTSGIDATKEHLQSLAQEMQETQLGQMLLGITDDDVQNFGDLTKKTKDHLANFYNDIAVLKEETADPETGEPASSVSGPDPAKHHELWKAVLHRYKGGFKDLKKGWDSLDASQKQAITQAGDSFVKNTEIMAHAGLMGKKEARTFAKAQNIMDTYAGATAAFKAMAGIPVIGPALGIAAALAAIGAGVARGKEIEKAQFGFSGMVDTPTTFLAGEAGAEMVNVTPLDGPNLAGPQGGGITVNVSGNILSSEWVEDELPSLMAEAIRRGSDYGIG